MKFKFLNRLNQFVEHDVFMIRLTRAVFLVACLFVFIVVVAVFVTVLGRHHPDLVPLLMLLLPVVMFIPSMALARSVGILARTLMFWK